jgi:hypothetical protein
VDIVTVYCLFALHPISPPNIYFDNGVLGEPIAHLAFVDQLASATTSIMSLMSSCAGSQETGVHSCLVVGHNAG